MDAKSIGKKIYTLRKQNGFTQRELADKVNVTNKAVSKWENGVNFPDPGIMDDLAEALGVTVTELIEAKEEDIKVNKPLLWAAIAAGLAPVVCAFVAAGLELFGKSGYVILGLEALAFVVIFFNFILNEKFLWNHKDGRTALGVIQFSMSMGIIMNLMYTFVEGTDLAGFVLYLVLWVIECIQEMNCTKNSKGLIHRAAAFAAATLVFAFLVCWSHPVKW